MIRETKPSISVIVTADRNERYLGECLQSILMQTRKPDEIVVVYNSFSKATLNHLSRIFPTVRFLKTNARSASSARNHGITHSLGDLICLLDGDDLWSTNKLKLQEDLLLSGKYDLVYSGGIEVAHDLRILREHFPLVEGKFLSALRYNPTAALISLGCSSAMLRRTLLFKVGVFEESLTSFAEDLEFFARCLRYGSTGFVSAPLIVYRRHATNESNKGIVRFVFWNWRSMRLITKKSDESLYIKFIFTLRLVKLLVKSLTLSILNRLK